MHVRKVTVASAVAALAISGLAAGGSSPALADGRGPRATATGGSATAGEVSQQNTAQQSRQNNHCSHDNNGSPLNLSDSRLDGRCVTVDDSFNYYSLVRSGDARAEGGSGITGVVEQNTAQLGRQNNNCSNRASTALSLTDSRFKSLCLDKDTSRNKHTRVKGGGAKAKAGAATVRGFFSQTTAQEGRQNNNCDGQNNSVITVMDSEGASLCANKDTSRNKYTRVKGGGAKAAAGTGAGNFVRHENTAQEGRQNNNCGSFASASVDATDARLSSECTNKDRSKNHKTVVKAGGAKVKSGNDLGAPDAENTAQEGRQNNNCNDVSVTALEFVGSEGDSRCVNKDRSKNHKTVVKSGGAKADGGAGTTISEQNTAQEGRQNNNCANLNVANPTLTDSHGKLRCTNKDRSKNHKTVVKSGAAKAKGGDGLATVQQQNTAQAGRQNNDCANGNETDLALTDSRKRVNCKTLDASKNVRTKVKRGAVKAEGGDGALDLFQQNTAQTGRQSNSCGNSNNTTVTASDSRSTTQCVAVDRSKNIGSSYQ